MSSKIREAVSRLVREIEDGMLVDVSSKFECDLAKTLLDDVKSVLAEPLKNCEVGTVEEQTERFRKFCLAHTHKNGTDFRCHKNCPAKNYIGGWGIPYCQVRWGQMPYKSEVKNGQTNV